MRLALLLTGVGTGALAISTAVLAQSQAENHDYDALGRLVATVVDDGNAADEVRSYCFDATGNRTKLRLSPDGSTAKCELLPTPSPTPTPTPTSGSAPAPAPTPTPTSNHRPVAQDDSLPPRFCDTSTFINVTANDRDMEDHPTRPQLVRIDRDSGGTASANKISSSSVEIVFGPVEGTTRFKYVVEDSEGASDEARLTVSCQGDLR